MDAPRGTGSPECCRLLFLWAPARLVRQEAVGEVGAMKRLALVLLPVAVIATSVVFLISLGAAASPGDTWTVPAALNSNAASDSGADGAPHVTTDGAGNWVAVWDYADDPNHGTDWDILAARSADNGVTWTAPAALNSNAATDSGNDWSPQVTTDGAGNWVVVWWSEDDLGGTIGTDGDILVSRSTDYGATWTAAATLNTNAATDSGYDVSPEVTTDGASNWVAVWQSGDSLGGTIGTDYDILVSRSTDNGATWTAPVALNTNAASDSGEDLAPQVTTDGAGKWLAAWHSYGTFGWDYDIVVSRSTNNGATWTAPAALNSNAASDSGWDYAPELATDGAGNWVAVWQSNENLGGTIGTDPDILVARSTDNGVTWMAPAALNSNAASDSGPDYTPNVATDGAGNWVAVWDSEDSLGGTIGTDGDVLVSRSTDNGATWTAVGTLNTNAANDSGHDAFPRVATDGAGNWLTVWESNENLGGTIGTDRDILGSRSPAPAVGGTIEFQSDASAPSAQQSDSAVPPYGALSGIAAGAAIAIAASAWYARRRWVR